MIRKIIAYLESKLTIRTIGFTKEEAIQESVMFTAEEMYNFLLHIEGMDEELASRVVDGLQGCMEDES